jgi:hypothetical protein
MLQMEPQEKNSPALEFRYRVQCIKKRQSYAKIHKYRKGLIYRTELIFTVGPSSKCLLFKNFL